MREFEVDPIPVVLDRVAGNADVARILAQPDIREKFMTLGADPTPTTPERFAAIIKTDAATSGRIIKTAGVRAN